MISDNLIFRIGFLGILFMEMEKTWWYGKVDFSTLIKRDFMLLKYLFSEILAITQMQNIYECKMITPTGYSESSLTFAKKKLE